MDVICIDSSIDSYFKVEDVKVTVGKVYSMDMIINKDKDNVQLDSALFWIKDDIGHHHLVKFGHFMTIEDYRDKQLNELGINGFKK